MSVKEYRTAAEARGGLLVMRATPGVAVGDRVPIQDPTGGPRNRPVVRGTAAEVRILGFEGTQDKDRD